VAKSSNQHGGNAENLKPESTTKIFVFYSKTKVLPQKVSIL